MNVMTNHSGLSDVSLQRMLINQLATTIWRRSIAVESIELFGSLSRGGGSLESDYDLIVCVDGWTAALWQYAVRDIVEDDVYDRSAAEIRRDLALEAIGLDLSEIVNATGINPWKLDIFLFPRDWRDRLPQLQQLGRHVDPHFMANIAHDALRFDPVNGFAFPAERRTFFVDPTANEEGLGSLIISDARLLIRPALPGQYPASVKHDSRHAYRMLNLGNDMGRYQWHIVSQFDVRTTRLMLGPVFYAYLDMTCMELWCNAQVRYLVHGDPMETAWHGFDDGSYTMTINVYCNVTPDRTEAFLARLTGDPGINSDQYVIVRPDSSESGYSARHFGVIDDETAAQQ